MKHPTFEEFLQEKHGNGYMGTDDNMPDAFENWESNLDIQEVEAYAQEYGDSIVKKYEDFINDKNALAIDIH